MLLTSAALVLLMTVLLSFYRSSDSTQKAIVETKEGITAVALASSVIEDAQGQNFDQNSITMADTSVNQLTIPSKLGMETGESYPDSINDFDDYNNLSYTVVDSMGGTYNVNCKVVYVNPSTPDVVSATATWHKKLTVYVSSPQMLDTVQAQFIMSYWYFR
ncbi:MAG TPA: hypothetical protein VKI62_08470 [Bacteroidota bacterium]|nr:hypothetical protein [Bacteroidota bacterium]